MLYNETAYTDFKQHFIAKPRKNLKLTPVIQHKIEEHSYLQYYFFNFSFCL